MEEQDARDGAALRRLRDALPDKVSFELTAMPDGWAVEFWHWPEPQYKGPPGLFAGKTIEEAADGARKSLAAKSVTAPI